MRRALPVRPLPIASALVLLVALAWLVVEALRAPAPLPVFSHCAPF